jgi:hypothetical protein
MSLDGIPLNDDELSKVGFVMGCIWYSDEELAASLGEIKGDLEYAFDVTDITLASIDQDHARVAMAQAISFAAALQKIGSEPDVERLMLAVDFIDADDQFDVKQIKGVALDRMLAVAIDYESQSLTGGVTQAVARLSDLRRQAATALHSRGYAGRYYEAQIGFAG